MAAEGGIGRCQYEDMQRLREDHAARPSLPTLPASTRPRRQRAADGEDESIRTEHRAVAETPRRRHRTRRTPLPALRLRALSDCSSRRRDGWEPLAFRIG